jgi:hypothetical protein
MVMDFPLVKVVPEGTFEAWLKSIGKLGGQNKVPRLVNNRAILEQLLQIVESKKMYK